MITKHYILFALIPIILTLQIIFFIHYQRIIRMCRKIMHRLFPSTIPSWKIAMEIFHPSLARPRFLSLHTLAAITGRDDLLQLAKEMKKSGEVSISFCSTVKSPVFALRHLRSTNNPEVWDTVKSFVKMWPFPKYRGFRGVDGYWTGGQYGSGRYIPPITAMNEPFIEADYYYANKIIIALRRAGKAPGIQEYKIN